MLEQYYDGDGHHCACNCCQKAHEKQENHLIEEIKEVIVENNEDKEE